MAERLKHVEGNTDEAGKQAAKYQRHVPTETKTHGMEREPEGTSLSEDIHAHTNRPHKGDVGRPGTNEEVFQGSKRRELP